MGCKKNTQFGFISYFGIIFSGAVLLRGGRELWMIAKEMEIQGDAVLSIIQLFPLLLHIIQ